jgi:Eukaryotic cytochrome b561
LNFLGVGALVAGLVVIGNPSLAKIYTYPIYERERVRADIRCLEMNKGSHPHFTSIHGRLGLITFTLIGIQAIVGFVQYWIPELVLGSVDNGKAIYKYHRSHAPITSLMI